MTARELLLILINSEKRQEFVEALLSERWISLDETIIIGDESFLGISSVGESVSLLHTIHRTIRRRIAEESGVVERDVPDSEIDALFTPKMLADISSIVDRVLLERALHEEEEETPGSVTEPTRTLVAGSLSTGPGLSIMGAGTDSRIETGFAGASEDGLSLPRTMGFGKKPSPRLSDMMSLGEYDYARTTRGWGPGSLRRKACQLFSTLGIPTRGDWIWSLTPFGDGCVSPPAGDTESHCWGWKEYGINHPPESKDRTFPNQHYQIVGFREVSFDIASRSTWQREILGHITGLPEIILDKIIGGFPGVIPHHAITREAIPAPESLGISQTWWTVMHLVAGGFCVAHVSDGSSIDVLYDIWSHPTDIEEDTVMQRGSSHELVELLTKAITRPELESHEKERRERSEWAYLVGEDSTDS